MKLKISRPSTALALVLGACVASNSWANGNFNTTLQFDTEICSRTDVKTNSGVDATACVGFVNDNDTTSLTDWNSIDWAAALEPYENNGTSDYVDPDGFNSDSDLGLFGYTDWLGKDATTAFKCDSGTGNCTGEVVTFDVTTGEITVNTSDTGGSPLPEFTEFAVILKQSTDWAAYLFPSDAASPLSYSWQGVGGGDSKYDLSHITFLYRSGEPWTPPQETPIPGTMLLLTAPLAGLAVWRRRRGQKNV
jgi:hypothetical protein